MELKPLIAPGVRGLQPYQPGKPVEELERELGITGIVKLASNENPKGSSPMVAESIRRILDGLGRYPDGSGFALKRKLASRLGVESAQLTLGNGSNDVLEIITRSFVQPGEGVVISEHAFAVYELAARSVNAAIKIVPAKAFGHDLVGMASAINSDTRLVFIANPNNPTGTYLSRGEIVDFLAALPDHVLAVLDEAYFEYVAAPEYPNGLTLLADFPGLIVTRTFSKAYGIAGLRVGYSVASVEITEVLNRVRQPFNVNSLALAGAQAALGDHEFVAQSVLENKDGLGFLTRELSHLGLEVIPSQANFVCVRVGPAASKIYEAMLRQGVIVRPVANYGLPEHLRITVGLPPENERALEALAYAMQADGRA